MISEHINKNNTIHRPSFYYNFKFSALATTRRISLPFEVSKPVAKTRPKHPFDGNYL